MINVNAVVEEESQEVGNDGIENEANQEDTNDVAQQEGESNANGEAVEGTDGEGNQEDGGAVGENEVDPIKEINSLREEIKQLREQRAEKKEPEQEQFKEPSEEEKIKFEEKTGVSWAHHSHTSGLIAFAIGQMMQKMEGRFAEMTQGDTIKQIAGHVNEKGQKVFQDIERYREGIKGFLGKFRPELRNNKELIMDAYYYAKGKGADASVKKVITSKEINKKINKGFRPSQPDNGMRPGNKGGAGIKLTPLQESARKAANMSTEEYVKYMKKGK